MVRGVTVPHVRKHPYLITSNKRQKRNQKLGETIDFKL